MADSANGGAQGRAILLRFSDEGADDARRFLESEAGVPVLTMRPSDALRALRAERHQLRNCRLLGLVGTPPEDGIGYSLAAVIALLARPPRGGPQGARPGAGGRI